MVNAKLQSSFPYFTAYMFAGKYSRVLLLLIIGFNVSVFTCCTAPQSNKPTGPYYDLKGQVEAQVKLLNQLKAGSNKHAVTGNKTEDISLKSINWEQELELFKEADITKPALSGLYKTDSISQDGRTYVHYTASYSQAPVRYIKLVLEGKKRTLVRAEAQIKKDNFLTEGSFTISIHLKNTPEGASLEHYKAEGWNKVFGSDTTRYSLSGTVTNVQ